MTDLCKEFPDLDPKFFLQSIIIVFDVYEATGKEPGAERWSDFRKYREQVVKDITREWSKASTIDDAEFGWSEDRVIRYWKRFRKMTPDQRSRLARSVGLQQGFTGTARMPTDLPPQKKGR